MGLCYGGGLAGRIACRFMSGGALWGQGIWEKWGHSALGSARPPYLGCEVFRSHSASCMWWWWGAVCRTSPPTFIMVPDTDPESCSLSRKKVPHRAWSLSWPGRHACMGETGGQKLPKPSTERARGCVCLGISATPYLCFPKKTNQHVLMISEEFKNNIVNCYE